MTNQGAEQAILDKLEPKWLAQGYRVIRQPARENLPQFFDRYLPDAVLLGRIPQVAVEIVGKGNSAAEARIARLATLLEGHDDWRLEVIYGGEKIHVPPVASRESLQDLLASIRRLADDEPRAALVLVWAALEATARRLEPSKMKQPQTAGGTVELLAGTGYATPNEAEFLRQAVVWRDQFVHGDLAIRPTADQIRKLAIIVENVLKFIDKQPESAALVQS
jgi:hypothetical protein